MIAIPYPMVVPRSAKHPHPHSTVQSPSSLSQPPSLAIHIRHSLCKTIPVDSHMVTHTQEHIRQPFHIQGHLFNQSQSYTQPISYVETKYKTQENSVNQSKSNSDTGTPS